jgi:hypothetical protein
MFVCPLAILYYLNWFFFISGDPTGVVLFYQYFIHIFMYVILTAGCIFVAGLYVRRKVTAGKKPDTLPKIVDHDNVKYLFEQPLMRSSFVWGLNREEIRSPITVAERRLSVLPALSQVVSGHEQDTPVKNYRITVRYEKPIELEGVELDMSFIESPKHHETMHITSNIFDGNWERLGLPMLKIVEDPEENDNILKSWYGVVE